MQPALWLKPALVTTTMLALAAAARGAIAGGPSAPFTDVTVIGPGPANADRTLANADSLAHVIAAHDPFRASRTPSSARFDLQAAPGNVPSPQALVRPQLALAGIVTGREPAALLDGLPGTDGTRVLRAGERVGDFLVQEIGRDWVVVVGRDTTWTLRVRTRFQ